MAQIPAIANEAVTIISDPKENLRDRVIYDAIDLRDCIGCDYLKINQTSRDMSCQVPEVSACPTVMKTVLDNMKTPVENIDTSGAQEFVSHVKGSVSVTDGAPITQMYRVWAKQVSTDEAEIEAPSLQSAYAQCEEMVRSGALYPGITSEVLFGVEPANSENHVDYTIIGESQGIVDVIHCKGPLPDAIMTVHDLQYDILCVFAGKQDDLTDNG